LALSQTSVKAVTLVAVSRWLCEVVVILSRRQA